MSTSTPGVRPFHGHAPGTREVFWRDKSTRLYGQIDAPRDELLDKSTSLFCDLHATSGCGSSLAPLPTSSGAPGWAEVTHNFVMRLCIDHRTLVVWKFEIKRKS